MAILNLDLNEFANLYCISVLVLSFLKIHFDFVCFLWNIYENKLFSLLDCPHNAGSVFNFFFVFLVMFSFIFSATFWVLFIPFFNSSNISFLVFYVVFFI